MHAAAESSSPLWAARNMIGRERTRPRRNRPSFGHNLAIAEMINYAAIHRAHPPIPEHIMPVTTWLGV